MSFRAWYAVHKWTSLVCTLFLLMLCITGLPLIFSHEINHALGYSADPPQLEVGQSGHAGRASIDAIVADAQARRPQDVPQFLVAEADEPELIYVRMADRVDSPGLTAFYTYDTRTGEFLSEFPLGKGFMDVMLRLHVDMYAGLGGTLFLGFMGLLLAASIVSGIHVYGPFMKKLRFGSIRRDRAARVKWLDQHNLLDMVTLVWLLVVGVTGTINALNQPIFAAWQASELKALAEPFRRQPPVQGAVSAEAAVAAAQRAQPGKSLSFMAYPGNDFATPQHFMAFMQGNTPLTSKLLSIVMIDARTGQVVTSGEMPWYVSTLMLSQPLHFGDYGGMALKILWVGLDLLSIWVLWSGLVLWWKRRTVTAEQKLAALQERQTNRSTQPVAAMPK
ncbi:PepSY-associated TM helix domain-containing protein [Massilia niastensis]|uniref:PepSY-associated TM helix domain-containing protein n=1 Tax=Massilia niastensis TaxID=544911 RepID=UPI00036B0655|nr:PepSY-associated TM helix domain-containing protein [Massilia niastensis]